MEFCDVSDRGIFRKYSVLRIDEEMIPRHIVFDVNWIAKDPKMYVPEKIAEENDFIRTFTGNTELLSIFDLAGIDYGRIDYAYEKGILRVWEINSNPVICSPLLEIHVSRRTSQSESARRIIKAFERLDQKIPHGPQQPVWDRSEYKERRIIRKARKAHRTHSEKLLGYGEKNLQQSNLDG